MAILNDYYCKICDSEEYDKWSDDVPVCCDRKMSVMLCPPKHFEWGAPKTFLHLRDEPFSSRSELRQYMNDHNLAPSPLADKHGGSRADMYDNCGKIFSYPGAPTGTNRLFRDGMRRHGE